MRVRVLLAAVALPLALWAILPLASPGQSKQQELAELQSKIDRARKKIGRKKGAERVLSTQIAGYQRRIRKLQGRITTLSGRQSVIETDLDAKRAELESLRTDLRAERARLVRLRNRLNETRRMLRIRLVEIYKAGKPDLVTVILNSDGFADLLERSEFIARISEQDRKIVNIVTAAKGDAVSSEKRLARLETRQQRVTEIVQQRRDEVAAIKMELIGTRVGYARTQAGKSAALNKVRSDRAHLQEHVDDLEAASSRIAQQLNALQPGNAGDLPIRQGSGSMIWPVNGPITGAFGEQRPGHMHAGIDIAAPRGHADPRRRLGARRAHAGHGRVGRLRQLHVRPAHGIALVVLRPPGALRHDRWARTSARARSSASSATPATRSARTCISRRASTARPSAR